MHSRNKIQRSKIHYFFLVQVRIEKKQDYHRNMNLKNFYIITMAQFCNLVSNSYKHVKIVMCATPGQIIEYRADVWDLCAESASV